MKDLGNGNEIINKLKEQGKRLATDVKEITVEIKKKEDNQKTELKEKIEKTKKIIKNKDHLEIV